MKRLTVPGWPHFEQDEIDAATRVLQSGKVNYWTGDECQAFEREFAAYVGCKYAVAVSNGTVALEASLAALGVGPGDDVIVTSRTFVASASSIVMRGARPVMADVDPVTQNVTMETLRDALTDATKAILLVHLAGWPCDMDPILQFARERGLFVIEDCAQAHGARYKGRPVGSFGDMAAFSFCQDKIMTTGGEGGMIITNDKSWWEKVWSLKDHGKNYNAVCDDEATTGFRWVHDSFGTNWRMTEMQAAIGRRQLMKLDDWVERRRRNAEVLNDCFKTQDALRVTLPPDDIYHSYYKYYVFVRAESLADGWNRDRLISSMLSEGIQCGSGSCSEIYLEKAFQDKAFRPSERLKNARTLGETSMMFLVHHRLSDDDMKATGEAVKRVLGRA